MGISQVDLYQINSDNTLRFVLGKKGVKPLVAVGLNPSTTDHNMTVSKVAGFAQRNGYDSFIMLNLYPQRSTSPNGMDLMLNSEHHAANLKAIVECLQQYKQVDLLAAWGEPIKARRFLVTCLSEINASVSDLNVKWWQIGRMTKSGHPRHPSRASYSAGMQNLCIASYLAAIK
ncbi:uncharacterized protein DUF1643 [Pontibacter ummariensis]|uniref:DUF1643 domain-containing protein n=1 Tax=Pontibacter ummariensis TaxID=1610492 RepID=A0A239CFZ4_9BACT|nr:DUF1643 domain-containing protein [Pontibacter ummariensis]PRY15031.1 uncharacterized protein DUF1643 [Pontibacter ummariensis]SNS19146.1 Protein of unknown function [Pontibacter ummariensis]